jgi:hypothetical protein
MSTVKGGPQKRVGCDTGTHRSGGSEGTKRKQAAARAAAVTERGRQRRQRPSHKVGAAKKAAGATAAAAAGNGWQRSRRPLQKAGGGDRGGRCSKRAAVAASRHRKRAADETAAVA